MTSMRRTLLPCFLISLVTSLVLTPVHALACPVCFGEPDTATTHGLQAAVAVLGGTTAVVLAFAAALVLRIRARARRSDTEPWA